jgi:hypothetical protein
MERNLKVLLIYTKIHEADRKKGQGGLNPSSLLDWIESVNNQAGLSKTNSFQDGIFLDSVFLIFLPVSSFFFLPRDNILGGYKNGKSRT